MNVDVVLVRSEYSSNVGAAARAVANMGGKRLILIDPRCSLDNSAHQMAAGAQAVLNAVVIYPSLEDFYSKEGEGVRIALTRRGGRRRRVFSLKDTVETISPIEAKQVYLIFGPEADGLSQDDIAFVHHCCHLPVFGEFGSLNLAQAVLLSLYIVRSQFASVEDFQQVTQEGDEPIQPMYFPDELIKEWLTAMGFDIQARRSSAYLTLRRLLLHNRPTRHEVQVLEAILQQNIRKLTQRP